MLDYTLRLVLTTCTIPLTNPMQKLKPIATWSPSLYGIWNIDFPRVLIDFFGQTLWPVGQCTGLAFSEKNAVLAQWKSPGSTNGYWQIVREA